MKNIAVIGAGIIGICSSFFLQKKGFKVTLFDHKAPGSMTSYGHACTFANYGCIPINSPNLLKNIPEMLIKSKSPLSVDYKYILRNLPWAINFLKNCKKDKVEYIISSLANILSQANFSYEEIFSEVDVSKYINNSEALYLYHNEKEFNLSKESNILRRKNGFDFEELNANQIHEMEPNISKIYYNGVLFKGSRYTTNPLMISKKIFQTFIANGGTFINDKVKSINNKKDLIEIITENKSINFDKILVSAGIWSKELAFSVGDKFPLETERGYHVLFDNNKLVNRPIGWHRSGIYLVQIEEGLRAAGTVEIAGLSNKLNSSRIKMIENESRKLLPNLGKIKSTWLGFRPTLPDSMPVIGMSVQNRNIYYSFGHQHIGWTLAAISGKIITDLIQYRKTNINITPFAPSRFC